MKVLMPVLHYWPVIGGLETWTQNIAERTSNKAEVFVVTGRVKSQLEKESLNQVNIFRTSLFSLTNLSYSSFLYIITALPFIFFKSLSVMKKEKINIIHSQGFLSGFLGYLLFKLTNTPYIVTVQRLEQSESFLRKLVYNNAKVCIAASNKIKEYFQQIECKNIEVIPNGIDLRRFQNLNREKNRKELGLNGEFAVISVARLQKVKGLRYLIKAIEILNNKFQVPNIRLIIIGDGTERENLKSLVEKLKIGGKVRFLGQVGNEKVLEYLSAADCFVLPSLKEGFGIVILEAMASKLSVVATKVGGILDIVENEKTGLLVQSKNSEEIANKIFEIYKKPELAEELTKNAFVNLYKYNWSNIANQVYEVYKIIL
ncbi:MAG: glycosyltransferase family 4 protein [Patescibacteria group bacterium]|nr:glycosyltransferase family 4 protein [Patescibacteria group bacterium]